MDTEVTRKIDKIFSIVSVIQTDVAVIKNNDIHTDKRLSAIDKKQFVMDVDIQALSKKETQITLIGKGVMGLVALLGSVSGALAVIIINHFLR